jgi:DNA-binding NarL/FixJ family response regulator
VLLIDDFPVVRRGLQQILSELLPDVSFAEASTVPAALALLEQQSWDIALVDLNLPGPDGLELLEQIAARHPEVPVLVVSGYPEEEFAVRCLRLGASGYLTKASAPDELAAAVRHVLAGRKYVSATLAEKLAGDVRRDLARASHDALSHRELQVLRLVATGRSTKQIAAELKVSEKTVATYRSRIAEKLRISTNVELTRYALQHNLVR